MIELTLIDWLGLFLHFCTLSLLAVGGGISVAPDMHRHLVANTGWLTDQQFTSSIALAQIAPGPNVLFVALMGWNVGINAGGWPLALLGAVLCLTGMVLPSSLLTLFSMRWAQNNRHRPGVKAFKSGLTPLVLALLLATTWLLFKPYLTQPTAAAAVSVVAVTAVATLVLLKTSIHLLWVLAAGAALGVLGWI